MKRLYKIITLCIAFVMLLSFGAMAATGEWIKDGKEWMYKKNGVILKGRWENIDGTSYYFTSDGYMAKGIIKIGQYYHIFDENGVPYAATGNFDINGRKYSIVGKGRIAGIEQIEKDDSWIYKFTKGNTTDENDPSNRKKVDFTLNITKVYNTIPPESVEKIKNKAMEGFDFMNGYNLMLTEMREQVKVKEDDLYQFAKIRIQDDNFNQYMDQFKGVINEYKDLALDIMEQLKTVFNPKEKTIENAKTKLDNVFGKMVEKYEDRLDMRLDKLSDIDDED